MPHPRPLLFLALWMLPAALAAKDSPPPAKVPGAPTAPDTAALTAGAHVLQDFTPMRQADLYLVGFHPMKDDPSQQMEAHHYCTQVNEDFAQCVLFDGNTKDARLDGIEYIISEKLFGQLPAQERRYWHPHNYEILSGQLVAPGVPDVAEKAAMKKKLNSYGKTWHVWRTGARGKPGDALPLGEPMLAWSFNHDGEAPPELIAGRDQRMKIDSAKKRRERADLAKAVHPQEGEDALKGAFQKGGGGR